MTELSINNLSGLANAIMAQVNSEGADEDPLKGKNNGY